MFCTIQNSKEARVKFYRILLCFACLTFWPTQSFSNTLQEAHKAFFKKDYKRALSIYQQLSENDEQTDSSILYNIALCFEKLGQFEKAKENYQQLLSLEPQHQASQEALARLQTSGQSSPQTARQAARLALQGRYEDASRIYMQLAQNEPSSEERARHFSNAAYSLKRMGKTEEALEAYSQALELSPNSKAIQLQVNSLTRLLKPEKPTRPKPQPDREEAKQSLQSFEADHSQVQALTPVAPQDLELPEEDEPEGIEQSTSAEEPSSPPEYSEEKRDPPSEKEALASLEDTQNSTSPGKLDAKEANRTPEVKFRHDALSAPLEVSPRQLPKKQGDSVLNSFQLGVILAFCIVVLATFAFLVFKKLFSTKESSGDAANEPQHAGDVHGELANFEMADFLQMLTMARKSGRIDVQTEKEKGFIEMAEGFLIQAEMGTHSGEVAIYRILSSKSGTFSYSKELPKAENVVPLNVSLEFIIMEWARQVDENGDSWRPGSSRKIYPLQA